MVTGIICKNRGLCERVAEASFFEDRLIKLHDE